jgi:hypothetical protein
MLPTCSQKITLDIIADFCKQLNINPGDPSPDLTNPEALKKVEELFKEHIKNKNKSGEIIR